MSWAPGALQVSFAGLEGFMRVDAAAAAALELVAPLQPRATWLSPHHAADADGGHGSFSQYGNSGNGGVGSNSSGLRGSSGSGSGMGWHTHSHHAGSGAAGASAAVRLPQSLFHVLNHTKTRSGARLLRASLLQPLSDPATIALRLDTVAALLADETRYFRLRAALPRLGALEALCGALGQVPRAPSLQTATQQLAQLGQLRAVLAALPELHAVCSMDNANSSGNRSNNSNSEGNTRHAARGNNNRDDDDGDDGNEDIARGNSGGSALLFETIGATLSAPHAAYLLSRLDAVLDPEITLARRQVSAPL